MSDIDKLREFFKRVNEYKPPELRDPPEESVCGPNPDRMYRMAESYCNFIAKVMEDPGHDFDPETGKFGLYEKSDPFKVDMGKLIKAALDVYVERLKAKAEAAKKKGVQ